jgi:hypothetical protein
VKRFETFLYVAAGVCFLGAADAWLNVGAADWIVDLCLTDPDATVPDAPSIFMDDHHRGHAFLWLTAGALFMMLASSLEYIESRFRPRSEPRIHRRRMLAALLHVAHAAGPVRQSVIDDAFQSATGDHLGRNEARSAYMSCFRKGAPTLSQILEGAEHPDERRSLVLGTTNVWMATGMDSKRATEKLNDVMSVLGLTADEIAAYLDSRHQNGSQSVFGEVRRITTSMFSARHA